MSKAIEVKMTRERSTPGTVVFKEVPVQGQDPVLKTQYIQNYVPGIAKAEAIKVTIEVVA